MRLLKINPDNSVSLTRVAGKETPNYAILSHTWEVNDQEVTYGDLLEGLGESKAGYRKIRFCKERANLDGIQYFWVDSCCIDKSNNAELAEAINSMFRWYQNAVKCYVYLADISTADINSRHFQHSRWFTRGWTLQELLAPRIVEFYSREGEQIGDKQSLEPQILQTTGIPVQALRQLGGLSQFGVEDRLSWAAKRETTIEEDQAYCLMGIFDVYLPLIYGEGKEHAFRRLRKEIFTQHARGAASFMDLPPSEKTDACLSHLGATDQSRFLSQALSRSKDACTWILTNQKYVSWLESRTSSLLWITAEAGYGKTTMAAHICQMVSTHQVPRTLESQKDKSDRVILYFFFQKSNHAAVKTATAALKTLIHQLASQVPAVLSTLLKQHELLSVNGDFEWSWENLSGVFGEMLDQTPPGLEVYCILDALDECAPESRILILDWMKGVIDENPPSITVQRPTVVLKILITSRPDGDVTDLLSGYPTMEITDTDTKSDIRVLIHRRMQEYASQRHLKPNVTRSIIQFLESNSHGMFLWIVLVIKELERRDERLSDEVLKSRLSSTPLTLMDTYNSILQSAPQTRKQDMWRIFRWLLFGSRNLTLVELEIALCLETGVSIWHDFVGDLKFLCGSLTRFGRPQEEVSLVHQTARDFLEAFSRNQSTTIVEGLNIDAESVHEHLAAICVQYLLRDEIFWALKQLLLPIRIESAYTEVMQGLFNRYPFLRYAIESWNFHAREVHTPSTSISAVIRSLLSSPTLRDAIMAFDYFSNKQTAFNIPVDQTPLHLAVYFNIPWLARMYISENRSSVHATCTTNDTPLIWASEMGSTECVRILLEAGANPNEFELDGWSALHWAARNGHLRVAKSLLTHGANLNQRDHMGHTPLEWALDRENWHVAAVLICWRDSGEFGRLGNPLEVERLVAQLARTYDIRHAKQLHDYRP